MVGDARVARGTGAGLQGPPRSEAIENSPGGRGQECMAPSRALRPQEGTEGNRSATTTPGWPTGHQSWEAPRDREVLHRKVGAPWRTDRYLEGSEVLQRPEPPSTARTAVTRPQYLAGREVQSTAGQPWLATTTEALVGLPTEDQPHTGNQAVPGPTVSSALGRYESGCPAPFRPAAV